MNLRLTAASDAARNGDFRLSLALLIIPENSKVILTDTTYTFGGHDPNCVHCLNENLGHDECLNVA